MTHSIPRLLILLALVAPAGAADLVVRERVVPGGPVIRLGDIAEVRRAAPDEASRLAAMPLMPAPAPGAEMVVRTQEIRNLLVAHGLDLNDLRFDGAVQVTIGQPKPMNPAEPAEAIEAADAPAPPRRQSGYRLVTEAPPRFSRKRPTAMSSQLGKLEEQLAEKITDYATRQTGDPMMQAGGVELEARNAKTMAEAIDETVVTTTDRLTLGPQRFLVSFNTAEGPVRFPVVASVERATPMVVAAVPIARGELLTAANLKVIPSEGDIRLAPGEERLTSIDPALGKEAARALRVGQALTDANCLPPVMVRRGDLVDVIAGGDGLRVRMSCKARRDGRFGETIEVEGLDDRRRLEARVVGPGECAVLATAGGAQSGYLATQSRNNGRNGRLQ